MASKTRLKPLSQPNRRRIGRTDCVPMAWLLAGMTPRIRRIHSPPVRSATATLIHLAREQGLDTAVIRGLSESLGGDQIAVLTPNRVRSAIDGRVLSAVATRQRR